MKNPKAYLFYKISSVLLALLLCFCFCLTAYRREKNASLYAVSGEKSYIRYVSFTVTCEALSDAMKLDIESQNTETPLDWVDLLAALGAGYGGDFSRYKKSDLEEAAKRFRTDPDAFSSLRYYSYYREAYGAVLDGWLGSYAVYIKGENGASVLTARYGLKAFSPIAKGFYYEDYDDFGATRTYGYRREHLGHDLLGSIGTPVVAVESGTVEAIGWNPYGGWRIGIRSFDKKRYYYYAHLRKGSPYAEGLCEGQTVTAGEVIGYLGRTGYSNTPDTNGIETPHLHFGLQLIFNPSQKDGNNQIWIDLYEITAFLSRNRSAVCRLEEGKGYRAVSPIVDYSIPD